MLDSQQTQPIFDKGCREINVMLDAGVVSDPTFADVALQAIKSHLIAKRNEITEKIYNFNLARTLNPENVEGLKKALSSQNK